MKPTSSVDVLRGVLLGTAIGDSIGLPYEGLSARRVSRWAPARLRQAFVLGRGMISDDTEHTFLLGHALAASSDVAGFRAGLARGLRRWLLTIPAGIGLATLRALTRLNLGMGPDRSGVPSAGNGPAMRTALLGLCVPPEQLSAYCVAATTLTHTDPRALSGALAVALAVRHAAEGLAGVALIQAVASGIEEPEMKAALHQAGTALQEGRTAQAYVRDIGLEDGVTGFVMHTVPVAVFVAAWASSFEQAIDVTVRMGGDTDSVGAIVGAIAGGRFGVSGIPADWLASLRDWPLSVHRIESLAVALAENTAPPRYRFGGALVRNLTCFLPLVLLHGFRRLAPPY